MRLVKCLGEKFLLPILSMCTLIFLNQLSWPNVAYWGLHSPGFIDMSATLKYGRCFREFGLAIYGQVPEPGCSNFVYGSSLVRVLQYVPNTQFYTQLFSFFLMGSLSIIIGVSISKLQINLFWKIAFQISILVSPPISLLFERGNIDAIILVFIVLGTYLIAKTEFTFLGFIVLAFSALCKFYTLPLVIIYFLYLRGFSKIRLILAMGFTCYLAIADFMRITALPATSPYASFGNRVFSDYLANFTELNVTPIRIIGEVIGFCLFLLPLIVQSQRMNNYRLNFRESELRETVLLFSTLLVLMSCYFFGRNYDYRLVFLVMVSILLGNYSTGTIRILILLGLDLCLYLSYNINALGEAIGDSFLAIYLGSVTAMLCFFNKDRFILFLRKYTDTMRSPQ